MLRMAIYDKIAQNGSKGSYNGPIFAVASRDDQLWSYLPLYYQLYAILGDCVRLRSKCQMSARETKNGGKCYNMIYYSGIRPVMTIFDTV